MPIPRYVTTRDIVIPAGTELDPAPTKTERFTPHVEAILGVTKDTTAYWTMDLSDAIDAGLVKEA